MGDMADIALGEILDPWGVESWREDEYYNPKEDGHPGNYPFTRSYPATLPRSKTVTCRLCKTGGLVWAKVPKPYGPKWRLGFYTNIGAWKEHRCEAHGWKVNKEKKTCKHCGTDNLYWIRDGDSWRLTDGDSIHYCEEYEK